MLGEWMAKEIREQPRVFEENSDSYFEQARKCVADGRFDMVLLAARGSSDNAAAYARYLIEVFLGIPAALAAPSVLTKFGTRVRYSKCLAIGISQSGAAPDVAEVLGALREDGHTTLGITNTPGSRLTEAAEFSLLLNAGEERSVAATKTYSASLLALYQIVRALGADLPAPTPSRLPNEAWVQQASETAQTSSGAVVRCQPLFALGRGFGFATCQESALKLMECALLPCKAYSSADFEHGPKALAGHGSAIISYDGPKPELADQGCLVIQAPDCGQEESPLEPLWDAIFLQWLALDAARARGLDPDHPQYIQKVTKTL